MSGLGRHADTIAGGLIALFGAWFLWEATILREGPGYVAVGPRVFPLIVGAGLLLSGMAVLLGDLRRRPDAELPHKSGYPVKERCLRTRVTEGAEG